MGVGEGVDGDWGVRGWGGGWAMGDGEGLGRDWGETKLIGVCRRYRGRTIQAPRSIGGSGESGGRGEISWFACTPHYQGRKREGRTLLKLWGDIGMQ